MAKAVHSTDGKLLGQTNVVLVKTPILGQFRLRTRITNIRWGGGWGFGVCFVLLLQGLFWRISKQICRDSLLSIAFSDNTSRSSISTQGEELINCKG